MPYVWETKLWPHLVWDKAELAEQLGKTRLNQGKLLSRVSSLDMKLGLEARAEIMTEEALKTAAIEGEILNVQSVRSSVARHLGLPTGGLSMPDRNADGLVDVLIDAAVNYKKALTGKRIKGWHAALFPTGYSGMHKIRVGQWRGPGPMRVVSGPIGREKIHFEAPPFKRVAKEMSHFLSWWRKSLGEEEGLIRAGVAHFKFVTVHPFEDGNGRLARALTDMALAQDEDLEKRFYSLSSQIMVERRDYYKVLERCQKGGGDITEWLVWFLQCTERAIGRSQKLIADVLAKTEFWHRHLKTSMNENQKKVVGRLLDAGPGQFEGGLTTRKYVSMAKVSRATAYREIIDLVKKDVLHQNEGRGRSVSYDLVWHQILDTGNA